MLVGSCYDSMRCDLVETAAVRWCCLIVNCEKRLFVSSLSKRGARIIAVPMLDSTGPQIPIEGAVNQE
jgi:hypothetical protein